MDRTFILWLATRESIAIKTKMPCVVTVLLMSLVPVSAFAPNNVNAARDPLHEIGHMLDELPTLGRNNL